MMARTIRAVSRRDAKAFLHGHASSCHAARGIPGRGSCGISIVRPSRAGVVPCTLDNGSYDGVRQTLSMPVSDPQAALIGRYMRRRPRQAAGAGCGRRAAVVSTARLGAGVPASDPPVHAGMRVADAARRSGPDREAAPRTAGSEMLRPSAACRARDGPAERRPPACGRGDGAAHAETGGGAGA